jgi:hypothetical protein
VYRILYRLIFGLTRLAVRSGRSKDLEIVVLCHQTRRSSPPVGAEYSAVGVDQRFRDAILNAQALLKDLLLGRCHRFQCLR